LRYAEGVEVQWRHDANWLIAAGSFHKVKFLPALGTVSAMAD